MFMRVFKDYYTQVLESYRSLTNASYQNNMFYFQTFVIETTSDVTDGPAGLIATLNRVCEEACTAAKNGYQLIVLSDKGAGPKRLFAFLSID